MLFLFDETVAVLPAKISVGGGQKCKSPSV